MSHDTTESNAVQERTRWSLVVNIAVVAAAVGVLACCLWPFSTDRRPSVRSQCKNNLKQFGLALHNFHDTHDAFPLAFSTDSGGRTLHSWRALLLPQLDQAPLFNLLDFDEPWDSPHNRPLANTKLPIFRCPSDEHDPAAGGDPLDTNYVAVVGDQTAWPGSRPLSLSDIEDDTRNTILIVEVANSGIHWMEPRDLHVLQMAPKINAKSGQGISSRHKGGAYVLFVDGSVRILNDSISEDVLRSLLTVNGGEKIAEF